MSKRWFVLQDDGELGPLTLSELRERIANGSLERTHLVVDESDRLAPAGTVVDLFPDGEVEDSATDVAMTPGLNLFRAGLYHEARHAFESLRGTLEIARDADIIGRHESVFQNLLASNLCWLGLSCFKLRDTASGVSCFDELEQMDRDLHEGIDLNAHRSLRLDISEFDGDTGCEQLQSIGEELASENQLDGASACLRLACYLGVMHADRFNLGTGIPTRLIDLYSTTNRHEEGFRWISDLIHMRPDDDMLLYPFAELCFRTERYSEAIEAFERARRFDAGFPLEQITADVQKHFEEIGGLFGRDNAELEKARTDFLQAVKTNALGWSAEGCFAIGRSYFEIKKYDEALLHFRLAIILWETSRTGRAESRFDYWNCLYWCGRTAVEHRDYDLAVAALECAMAIKSNPDLTRWLQKAQMANDSQAK
jgi:tetratricopeptide (TPR) repeat protein